MTTITIEIDANSGKQVIWSELVGKPVPLPVENLYLRMSDGHIFTVPPGPFSRGQSLQRLRPHEIEMIQFWLAERGGKIKPDIFAGEPEPGG